MKLKILILPTLLILDFALAIFYVKPNVDIILEKQDEIAAVEEVLAKVDTVKGNVGSITQALENRSRDRDFVLEYYPTTIDEERVVDLFNYLAQQSGTVVMKVSIISLAAKLPAGSTYNDFINLGSTPEEAEQLATAAAESVPGSYLATVGVVGEYPNIKDFFNRVRHADRLHVGKEFSIERREETEKIVDENGVESTSDGYLYGSYVAEFPYLKRQKASDVLNDPLFQTAAFDFQALDAVADYVAYPLPTLEEGSSGQINPFEVTLP